VESAAPEVAGLGLLDMTVTFEQDKRTVQARGTLTGAADWLAPLAGAAVEGYEIHSGVNAFGENARFWMRLEGDNAVPVYGKSGVVSTLAAADGYIVVGRDTEGLLSGAEVTVRLF
jgi:adenosylcobyric acid synthase